MTMTAFQYSQRIGAVSCTELCARRWQGPRKSSVRLDGHPTVWSYRAFLQTSRGRFFGLMPRRQALQRQSAERGASRARCGRSSGISAAIAIGRMKRSPSSSQKSCGAISRGSELPGALEQPAAAQASVIRLRTGACRGRKPRTSFGSAAA